MRIKSLRLLVKTKKDKIFRTSAIPNLFTFANVCFGVLAIIYVLDGNVFLAACALLLSIATDVLDGLCARRLKAFSLIGAELDSLADAVSFCLAPVIIIYRLVLIPNIFYFCVLLFYVCCGIFRLARFTACQKRVTYFVGLPSPAAAFVIINLVLYKKLVSVALAKFNLTKWSFNNIMPTFTFNDLTYSFSLMEDLFFQIAANILVRTWTLTFNKWN